MCVCLVLSWLLLVGEQALPGSREAGEALEMINRLPDGDLKSDLLIQYPTVLQRNLHVRQQLLEFERNPTAETQDRDPFGDGDQSPLEGEETEEEEASASCDRRPFITTITCPSKPLSVK